MFSIIHYCKIFNNMITTIRVMKAEEICALAKNLARDYESFEEGCISSCIFDTIFGPVEAKHLFREKDSTILFRQDENIGYLQFTNPVKRHVALDEEVLHLYRSLSCILQDIPFEFPKDKKRKTFYVMRDWRNTGIGTLLMMTGLAVAKDMCDGQLMMHGGGIVNSKFFSNRDFNMCGTYGMYLMPPNEIKDVELKRRYFNGLRNIYNELKYENPMSTIFRLSP